MTTDIQDCTKSKEGCGMYMGYRHTSGAKAWCGDDVGTHIIYCQKCRGCDNRNNHNQKGGIKK